MPMLRPRSITRRAVFQHWSSPGWQRQSDVTWLQVWAEDVQTGDPELQKWSSSNHEEVELSRWGWAEVVPLWHTLHPQNPLNLLAATGIKQVKTEAREKQAVT